MEAHSWKVKVGPRLAALGVIPINYNLLHL